MFITNYSDKLHLYLRNNISSHICESVKFPRFYFKPILNNMSQFPQSLIEAGRSLDINNFDVAAGLREDTVNDFFKAHWKLQSEAEDSIYNGGGSLPEAALEYSYSIKSSAHVDFSPFSPSDFSKIHRSWLRTVPEINRFILESEKAGMTSSPLDTPPPPNVQVGISTINIAIEAKPEGEDPIRVEITISMKVTGYVETYRKNGRVVV
jgi:hypothetical protein